LIEQLIGKDPALYSITVPRTFMTMAAIFSVAVIGIAQLYRVPPLGWKPEGWNQSEGVKVSSGLSTKQMLGTWQFYALFVTYFLGGWWGRKRLDRPLRCCRRSEKVGHS